MADHIVDPALFVPPSTQENYLDAARAAAEANGTDLSDEWGRMVETFKRNHDQDGAAGWNHLAAWAEDTDPAAFAGPTPEAVRAARELANAIQDPTPPPALDLDDPAVAESVRHAHDSIARRSRPVSEQGDDQDEDGEEREDGRPRRTATPPRKTTR